MEILREKRARDRSCAGFRRSSRTRRRGHRAALRRGSRLEPSVEDAPRAPRRMAAAIGRAIDDRGGAQPAQLAIADIDRGHADGRRFQDAAGGVADHGVGKPQRGPVAFAAERGEQFRLVRPRRDEGPDRVVDRAIAGIGVDAGEDEAAVARSRPARPAVLRHSPHPPRGLCRGRMQGDQQEALGAAQSELRKQFGRGRSRAPCSRDRGRARRH